MSKKMVRAIE